MRAGSFLRPLRHRQLHRFRICAEVDVEIRAYRSGPLDHAAVSYVWLGATTFLLAAADTIGRS